MQLPADSVAGVIFPLPGQRQDDALVLWNELFPSNTPDGFQKNTHSPMLQSRAHAEIGGLMFNVSSQVGRVDVLLNGPTVNKAADVLVPRIEDVPEAVAKVAEILNRLALKYVPARLAIVLDLAVTVKPGEESAELRKIMPPYAFPENASDIGLQFNTRRQFRSIPELQMNRMMAWTSGQAGVLDPTTGAANLQSLSPFVGVKIDVNSAPDLALPTGSAETVIQEIMEEALAIRSEGCARLQS